jgi:hypothetical protein
MDARGYNLRVVSTRLSWRLVRGKAWPVLVWAETSVDEVAMAWKMIICAVCDECGHAWLTEGNPYRCAKCKSSLWNRKVVMPAPDSMSMSAVQPTSGGAASPQTRKRRDIW